MPLPRRQMFGWYDERREAYLLSQQPPDAPVRPALPFAAEQGLSAEEVLAIYLKRKRIDVSWYPPLTLVQSSALSKAQASAA